MEEDKKELAPSYTPYYEMPDGVKFSNETTFDVYEPKTRSTIKGYGADSVGNIRARRAWLEAVQPVSMFALQPQKESNTIVGNVLRATGSGITEFLAGIPSNVDSYARGVKSDFRRNSLLSNYLENADKLTDEENKKIIQSIGETLNMEDKYLKEVNDQLYKQNQRMMKSISEFYGVDEDTASSMFGRGLGSLLSAIAFNWVGGSVATLGMFGVQAGSEAYAEARQAGLSNYESINKANQMAVFEAVSEEVGLNLLLDSVKITKPIQAIAMSIINEGQQEAVQTLGENVIMADVRDQTVGEVVSDIITSFIIGGATGGLVGGIGRATGINIEKRKEQSKQKLMDVGIPEKTAQSAVDKLEILSNDKQFKTDVITEIINKQLDPDKYPNRSYDDLLKESVKYRDKFISQAQADFNVKEDIKSRISGLDEKDTNFATDIINSTLQSNYEAFGITPREQLEQTGLKIQSIAEDIVNNSRNVFNQEEQLFKRNIPSAKGLKVGQNIDGYGVVESKDENFIKIGGKDYDIFKAEILANQGAFNEIIDIPTTIKGEQLKIILDKNPMYDDYHTGIRSVDDIKSWDEIVEDGDNGEQFTWGDYSFEDAKRDLKNGKIIVYSSNPIKNGTFVSTSFIQAEQYAGGGKVYKKTVPLNDIAWINGDEGQFAKVKNKNTFFQQEQIQQEYTKPTININGVEKSALNSDGRPLGRTEEEIRNFYKWFGDSKVVDEEGKPLVVYHGTLAGGFATFKNAEKGIWFSDNEDVAGGYGYAIDDETGEYIRLKGDDSKRDNTKQGFWEQGIYETYLKLNNPLIIDFKGEVATDTSETEIYTEQARKQGNDGVIIKNIIDTVYGEQQKVANDYVVLNPNQIKSVDNRGTYSPDTGNIYYQETQNIRGMFDMTDSANRIIKIFKNGNRDTLVHELSHNFSIYRIELAIKNNKLNVLDPLFKHFNMEANVENAKKLMTSEYQEQIATMAVNYFTQETAPTAGLRRYFENLRQWAMNMWDSLVSKGLVSKKELSPDIVDFFDSMFGIKGEDIDLSNIKTKEKEIQQFLKDIVAGKKVNIGNYDINQIYDLIRRRDARIPRMPKNLKQAITGYGGIDIDFARNMYLINLMGMGDQKHQRLFRKDGKIKNETELMDFLTSNGFLSGTEIQTYDDLANRTQQILDMIENAENVYAEQDMWKIQEREYAEQVVDEADRILTDLDADDVLQALATIKEQDLTAIDVATAKRLGEKINQLGKDYRSIIDNLRKQMSKVSTQDNKKITMDKSNLQQVVDFINKQNLELKDKAKLLWEVNNVRNYNSLAELLSNIKNKAEEYYTKEQVNLLRNSIYRELQGTKAKKKEQKYDYENNKLFQELRQLSRLTQEQALEKYDTYSILDEMGNPSHHRELVKTFLAYKMNGANSSPQLLQHILSEIQNAKKIGKEAKDYLDFERKLEISQDKEKIVKNIENRKLSGKISGTIAKGLNNLYSMLNYVAGLDIAKKFEMETVENEMQIKKSKILETQAKKAQEIYGLKTTGDLLNKFAEMREVIGTISTKGSSNVNLTYDLTKMGIIDLYNTSQNAKSKENLIYFYGEEQLENIFSMLSDQDIQFADSLRESVGDLYDKTNEVYIKVYQTDLNKLDNYWMQSSVKNQETDLLANFEYISNNPSFLKHRTSEKTLIVPKDAYSKYQSHVSGSVYYQEMALPFKKLRDTFNSQKIKNTIENKFGKDIWGYLDKQIDELSYGKYMKGMEQDAISSILNKMVNNFVVSKIALAPSVFVKQLTSITNYSENMGLGEWSAGFIEGLSHPKETKEFMEKYVGDFLKERCQSGYDEAIKRVVETAKDGKKTILSAKAKNNYTSALSYMSRMGDIGAIIYGGYPRLKQMINSGMSIEDATKQFKFESLGSQQSGLKSSLSGFQQNTNVFVRMMFAFKNTSSQYARKMNNAVVSYINGDISAQQASRILFNYGVIQPALYIMAGNLIGMAFGDDRDLTDGYMKQLGMQFVDWIPFVNSIVDGAISQFTDGYKKDGMSIIAYDDLMKAIKKIAKDDKNAYDLAVILGVFIDGMSGAPGSRVVRNLKPFLKEE